MLNVVFYILIALLIALAVIDIYAKIKINGLRATIEQLIVYAEKKFENGDNDNKVNYVLDGIYNILPSFAKAIISKNTLQRAIQKIFLELKEALDYVPQQKEITITAPKIEEADLGKLENSVKTSL